jgi:hypothetical protein
MGSHMMNKLQLHTSHALLNFTQPSVTMFVLEGGLSLVVQLPMFDAIFRLHIH